MKRKVGQEKKSCIIPDNYVPLLAFDRTHEPVTDPGRAERDVRDV